MSGWTVMLRGIRFRVGRSLLVLLIATVATASAVAAAGYLRASQQSVLTDGLRSAPSYRSDVVVGAVGLADTPGIEDAQLAINQAYAQFPLLRTALQPAIQAEDTDVVMTTADPAVTGGAAYLAYRQGACANVVLDSGACPTADGDVMISQRTADKADVKVGDSISAQFGAIQGEFAPEGTKLPKRNVSFKVVGVYTPKDINSAYWGGNPYFVFGEDDQSPTFLRFDTVFTSSEDDVRLDPGAGLNLHLELPVRPDAVGVDNVAQLRSDLSALGPQMQAKKMDATTGLGLLLDDVTTSDMALAKTIPVVAVPLLLLALFVLFIVVAALVEERAPELALAKLRGFGDGRAARFGVAEMLALIVLSGPLGLVVGYGITLLAGKFVLAAGTPTEFRWPLPVAAAVTVVLGGVCAWIATRNRLRQGVLALLRRVPARGGRRATFAMALVLAAVAASLVAAYLDRSSPIAWLAAPSIALIAGLLGARLLSALAGRRLRGSAKRGRIVGLLSGAWVARQPGRSRVVAILTIAVALLVFGAFGWDVGSQARHDYAVDTLGAPRVYTVETQYPADLVDAVHKADPSGNSMAVAWTQTYYNNKQVALYTVETQDLAKVGVWRGESASQVNSLVAGLRPTLAPRLTVHDSITVTANVRSVTPDKVSIAAFIEAPNQPPVPMQLGLLSPDKTIYTATLAGCESGCRLLGLTLSQFNPSGDQTLTGAPSTTKLDMDITGIEAQGISVDDFANPAYWSAVAPRTEEGVTFGVTPGAALGVHLSTQSAEDETISYNDSPLALPVLVSGGAKASDPGASTFTFPNIDSNVVNMSVAGRTARLPAGGPDAILGDINVAISMAERTGSLADASAVFYQVWANDSAPADLGTRLANNGVTVLATGSVDATLQQLSRGAPTLSLWFYLFSGGIALLLAVGVILLGTYIGSETRIYAYAALKVAGVPQRKLRSALVREYRSVLGISLVVGALAGGVGAVLMLPSIPLVSAGGPVGDVPYGGHMIALYAAIGVSVAAMAAVVLVALRILRRATPDRLREGVR